MIKAIVSRFTFEKHYSFFPYYRCLISSLMAKLDATPKPPKIMVHLYGVSKPNTTRLAPVMPFVRQLDFSAPLLGLGILILTPVTSSVTWQTPSITE